MDKTFTFYSKVLDTLIENNEFFQYYFQAPYSLIDRSVADMDEAFNCGKYNIEMYFGATRGCIVCDDCDEIIKFDLDTVEAYACEDELNVYHAAEMCGLSKCFVRARYIGTYTKTIYTYSSYNFDFENDDYFSEFDFQSMIKKDALTKCEITIKVPLFAYEKADNISFTSSAIEDEDEKVAKSHNSPLLERSEVIAASFVHEYGETIYEELSNFLIEWDVNDIHYGNIGWVGGRFVLIDYAGYHECE